MPIATDTAARQSQPDPQQDRSGATVPANIGHVLYILRILLCYGRHLADTLEHRAAARGFSIIAQCFGTAKVSVILAHLSRGILRALALERVLLARAARGRDLTILQPRTAAPGKAQPAAEPGTEPQAPPPPAAQTAASLPLRRATRDEQPFDLAHLPPMRQLDVEARRRTVGRLIDDICQDLGVAPGLCAGGFWNDIFDALRWYRGNLVRLSREMQRREVQFEKELDKDRSLGWPEQKREAIRRVLGFLIGEPPVNPHAVLATACMPAAAALRPP